MKESVKSISNGGITVDVMPAEAVQIYDQFGTVCHIRQEIKSQYPKRRMANSKSTGLFKNSEEDTEEYTNVRNTLVAVPEGLSEKEVQKELDSFKGIIQRITSFNLQDVLTDGDQWALENSEETGVTIESLAERYETRDSEGNRYSDGELRVDSEGEVVNDDLDQEYTRLFYQNEYTPDEDLRSTETISNNVDPRNENVEVNDEVLTS